MKGHFHKRLVGLPTIAKAWAECWPRLGLWSQPQEKKDAEFGHFSQCPNLNPCWALAPCLWWPPHLHWAFRTSRNEANDHH